MKSLQHHGLWWAGLLLYTTLLHTSMSVLDCPSVPEADGSSTIVRNSYSHGLASFPGSIPQLFFAACKKIPAFCTASDKNWGGGLGIRLAVAIIDSSQMYGQLVLILHS